MPDARCHRGPHPDDWRLFAQDQLPALRQAMHDFCWLLNRGYAGVSALKLVGDRYRLEARQRLAIQRSACTDEQLAIRTRRCIKIEQLARQALWIDGFNLLTTTEA